MHALKLTSTKRTDLLSILRELPDPRVERTRLHKFEDILVPTETVARLATDEFRRITGRARC